VVEIELSQMKLAWLETHGFDLDLWSCQKLRAKKFSESIYVIRTELTYYWLCCQLVCFSVVN